MKQVAGSLRLDLAQYRELAAFAQFGSELDKSTQAQLNRGVRLVEILKQPQYLPMPMEKMITSLFAGARGFLDDLPVDVLKDFEPQMLAFMESKYQALLSEIKEKKEISAELEDKLKKAISEFKTQYQAQSK